MTGESHVKLKAKILLLVTGILSALLITAPHFYLRVAGLILCLLVTGYSFLRLTGFADTIITPIPGLLILTLNAFLLNYTPLRNLRALYALPAILIPIILLLKRPVNDADLGSARMNASEPEGRDHPPESTQIKTARELAKRDQPVESQDDSSERKGGLEETRGREHAPLRDILLSAILCGATTLLIALIHLNQVRFVLIIILIAASSYGLAAALLLRLRDYGRLRRAALTIPFVLLLTLLAGTAGRYGLVVLGAAGILSALVAYIRRTRQRIGEIESQQMSEKDILERYGLIEDEVVVEVPELPEKDLRAVDPSRIKKKALRMVKRRKLDEEAGRASHDDPHKGEAGRNLAGFSDLLVMMLISILTLTSISLPYRVGEALFYLQVLLIPGYILTSAIAPLRDQISIPERLFLGFSTSIIISSVIALLMGGHVTFKPLPAGIIGTISLVLTPVAFIRRYRAGGLAYSVDPRRIPSPRRLSRDGKLSLILSVILVTLVAVTVYITLNPAPSERFTEFYILGPGGKAYGYPENVTAGEEVEVIVGVVNREYRNETYRMVVRMGGDVLRNETIKLGNGEKWEKRVNFTVTEAGEDQKLEFLLYRLPDTKKPYRSLHLFINVR
ncbi:hypothetical protein DNK57_01685 [Methanothermobacter thermautotrophicus]|uniref:DUF1616 domain-containing protein n=1 Tax=Methanothermobacter thermautotrophicus TaxID=145262 RepID=A0A842YMB3_METTF|nr:hypothetical protein [Methanothermobacter thermautotrophicus]